MARSRSSSGKGGSARSRPSSVKGGSLSRNRPSSVKGGTLSRNRPSSVKGGSLPGVSPIEVISYSNGDNLVSFKLGGRGDRVREFSDIDWGSVRSAVVGERYLCRFEFRGRDLVKASPLKRLSSDSRSVLVVSERGVKGWEFRSVERGGRRIFYGSSGLVVEDIVEFDLLLVRVDGVHVVGLVENYGCASGVGGINEISLRQHGVAIDFSDSALELADSFGGDSSITLGGGREDFCSLPFVTIDGLDAKDFDDAVYAERFSCGDFRLCVAIADVSYYVAGGSVLDSEALSRGNSIYLPGVVVPMLPFALSSGLCSLRSGVMRYGLCADVRISGSGEILSYDFKRIVLRSHERLVYESVDDFLGGGDLAVSDLVLESLGHLHDLYRVLSVGRRERGALEISVGDRRVELDSSGDVSGLSLLRQSESRKLIEELMIVGNVCAARYLSSHGLYGMHRNHESPPSDKVGYFGDMVVALGYKFDRFSISGGSFNAVCAEAHLRGESDVIENLVLRSQSQAYYSPEKVGHFGLGLSDYCHFTSPIRRYADLLVHRAIVGKLEGGGRLLSMPELLSIGESISDTERVAMSIERSAMDRISAYYLGRLDLAEVEVVVRSITDFAVFVYVEVACGDAIMSFSSLPRDYYRSLDCGSRLLGCDRGLLLKLGDRLKVRVSDIDSYAGRISVKYLEGGMVLTGKQIKEALKNAGEKDRKPKYDRSKRRGGKKSKSRR